MSGAVSRGGSFTRGYGCGVGIVIRQVRGGPRRRECTMYTPRRM